ncbi:MAG: acetate/propionate family kinase [Spirochaetales bacterium]|nr:acetate/propionate family kinase [Spirochaetales bacterium]
MEIIDFLTQKVPLFIGFPLDTLKEIIDASTVTSFEPNEAVIEFGETGRFLGVLLEGEAELSIADNTGERHRIDILKEGSIFGETSLMTGDRTIADVIGITRCTALIIPERVFSSIIISHPPAVTILSRSISGRMKEYSLGDKNVDIVASFVKKDIDPYGLRLQSSKPMKLLVINCGSSSLKYFLFDTADEKKNAEGKVERIGEDGTEHTYIAMGKKIKKILPTGSHKEALDAMIEELTAEYTGVIRLLDEITAVGHRVVHGGDKFINSIKITPNIIENIEKISDLAPLHNPINILGIRELQKLFPDIPHIAVFDTSFHHTLPPYAYLYGIPYKYFEEQKIRRYGFHGTSHFYVALKAAEYMKKPFNALEIITCHLGNGASICAVDHGRSVDTSMGLTPTEGLIMGTRCGNIDPAILVRIMRTENMSYDGLDALINRESGLKGISGISNDMREIQEAAEKGNHRAILATKTFAYQIRKYIGSYMAAMGGLDVLVFTGGIGEKSSWVRSLACQGLNCMGIIIDEKINKEGMGDKEVLEISAPHSQIKVFAIATNEARMIARETLRVLNTENLSKLITTQEEKPIPVEVSAHHIHLSREHVDALFGKGYQLTIMAELSQPGQFACNETVNLIGPKGTVNRVRVLGPERKQTQIEIAMTEQFKLGVQPPIRQSGDIEGTPGITIEGPAGTITIDKGVICALRHIHMSTEEALQYGLSDKDVVRVRIDGDRELIYGDVLIRVNPDYRLAMHIDTDEANAANIKTGMQGFIEGIQSKGLKG